jgi:predicted transcriptional regulator
MSKKSGDVKFAQLSAENRFVGATIDVVSLSDAGRTMAVWEVRELAHDVYRSLLDRVKVEGLMGPRGYVPDDVATSTKLEAPAISVAESVHHDHLVCLVCGRQFETLTRHVWAAHSLSEDEYRKRFGLAAYYPMSSRKYREMRARIAVKRHETGFRAAAKDETLTKEASLNAPRRGKMRRSNKGSANSPMT